ncbi:MAG: hypothetical protein JNK15_05785, partial [Planctomycetes bacterium]|nr:hypothetical protein [Planctomycetota bacterium]
MIRTAAPLLLALATAAAQAPTAAATPAADELAALAAKVETAHRPRGPVARVGELTASFAVHLLDPTAEQRGQVDLDVK